MNTIDSNQLRMLLSESLERTAFVIVDPVEEDEISGLAPVDFHASIGYAGPSSGHVYLSASTGFLTELASSILGCEPDEVRLESEGMDALTELANIVGGCVIVAIGGEQTPYALELPHTIASLPDTAGGVSCTVESMGERLTVTWCADAAKQAA